MYTLRILVTRPQTHTHTHKSTWNIETHRQIHTHISSSERTLFMWDARSSSQWFISLNRLTCHLPSLPSLCHRMPAKLAQWNHLPYIYPHGTQWHQQHLSTFTHAHLFKYYKWICLDGAQANSMYLEKSPLYHKHVLTQTCTVHRLFPLMIDKIVFLNETIWYSMLRLLCSLWCSSESRKVTKKLCFISDLCL